jgi:hypothetical protein
MEKDLKVVLNGGTDFMKSATIPIQWFFSAELAEMAPTHLLIVDYTGDELEKSLRRGYGELGIRYCVRISDTIKYLQIFTPGVHHLCFLTLRVKPGEEGKIGERIFSKNDGDYCNSITISKTDDVLQADWGGNYTKFLATTFVKIEVPEELFAKIPEKGFGRAIWNYVNGGLRSSEKPVDECANRKRFMLVFPLKLLFHGTFRLLLGIFATVLLIVAGVLTFIVGFIPNKILSTLGDLWNFNTPLRSIDEPWRTVKEYSDYDYCVLLVKKDGKKLMMPFTLLQLLLGLFVLDTIMLHWQIYIARILVVVAILGMFGGNISVIRVISKIIARFGKFIGNPIKKIKASIEDMNDKKDASLREKLWKEEDEKKKKYIDYLKTELPAENAPEKVDINHLPKAFKGETVKKFNVAFWSFKAIVCKPYPK